MKKLLYTDKAGNKLFVEDGKAAFRNAENKLIDAADSKSLLSRVAVKKAMLDNKNLFVKTSTPSNSKNFIYNASTGKVKK